jgi:hypothetical protein
MDVRTMLVRIGCDGRAGGGAAQSGSRLRRRAASQRWAPALRQNNSETTAN